MTLTTLNLAGVAIAGVGTAALTEPLHQVSGLCVDLWTLQQFSPGSSMNLT